MAGWLPTDLQMRLQRIEEYCGLIRAELLAIRGREIREFKSGPGIGCNLCLGGVVADPGSPCPRCGSTGTEKRRGD